MTVSVSIMAHPDREAFIPELHERLGVKAPVVWDEKQDRWDTGMRAMLEYDPDATHHLVIQDDALPCRDLIAGLERAAPYIPPTSPMVLYIGKVRPFRETIQRMVDQAGDVHVSWMVMSAVNWGPGILVPVDTLPEMIEYCDLWRRDVNYDRRISRFFEKDKRDCFYPWPSLVEHRKSPSLIANRGGVRQAHSFIGLEASALDVDWTGKRLRTSHRDNRWERKATHQNEAKQRLIEARRAEMEAKLERGEPV